MGSEIFVDTSGFYAILADDDSKHRTAIRILADSSRSKRGFVTTDYVLDELATLLKARGRGHMTGPFFEKLREGQACRVEWTDAERFQESLKFFLKHSDQPYSFTDCLSFWLMKTERIQDALSKDQHFRQAGFTALLL
jgi:uncharacterized protein